jgi:hypothetical protein
MKKLLLSVLCILIYFNGKAQFSNWIVVNSSNPYYSFSLPASPVFHNDLDVDYYSYSVDTALALQVHVMNDVSIDTDSELFSEALRENSGDTLRAIAQLFLVLCNADLVSIADIETDNHAGLDVGFSYNDLIAPEKLYSFIRIFRFNNRFLTFTITGIESDLARLQSYRNFFFASINL